jgi:hypothetical protein
MKVGAAAFDVIGEQQAVRVFAAARHGHAGLHLRHVHGEQVVIAFAGPSDERAPAVAVGSGFVSARARRRQRTRGAAEHSHASARSRRALGVVGPVALGGLLFRATAVAARNQEQRGK